MADNYSDTANRSRVAANILFASGQYHSSAYMAGYVVECYAKIIVMLVYGTDEKDVGKTYSHDLKGLSKELRTLAAEPTIGAMLNPSYFLDLKTVCNTLLTGHSKWHPNKRYAARDDAWTQQEAQDYLNEVAPVSRMLAQMKLDGLPFT